MSIQGIDVSKHQGSIDWPKVAASGVRFAILRAGYGNTAAQVDPYFAVNYTAARSAGLKVGVQLRLRPRRRGPRGRRLPAGAGRAQAGPAPVF